MTARLTGWLWVALALALACLAPSAARADLVMKPGGVTLEMLDAGGSPETRAGAHPDRLVQTFALEDTGGPEEDIRDIVVELPPGLSGDLDAVPPCPRALINQLFGFCEPPSQVGLLVGPGGGLFDLYSVQPASNEAAAFSARAAGTPIMFSGRLRSADQGLLLHLKNFERSPFTNLGVELAIELWGVPADHQSGTGVPRHALLTLPTRCDGGPLAVTVKVRTWEQPDRWLTGSGDTGHPLSGCEELRFEPSLEFGLGDRRADVPSGARIDLIFPQNPDPDGRAPAQARELSIAMPAGLTVSPGGTADLSACRDEAFGLGNGEEATCPASSRVGTIEMTAAGGEPTTGSVYLGEERPHERFRLLIAASAAGTTIKLAGSLRADPQTGRLTATMKGLPEVALGRMALSFDGGPNALFATPLACGPAPTSATFTPNSGGPPVQWSGSVAVAGQDGGPCSGPPPFAPTFSGGSTSTRAGGPASFLTTVRRRDGEALPRRLTIALPPGLSAALGTVARCAAAEAESGACPAASRIGSAVAELGPGESPARLGGEVFLTGPHRGAAFGVALVLGAEVGPLKLGTLVVRGALLVDPFTGRVAVEMDALPTIFEGVPVRFQTIGLDLDRPGFMRNPTSCRPARAVATLHSADGVLATPSSPFRVRGCVDLPFRPRFAIALRGKRELRKGGKPSLAMSMRMRAGSANLRGVEVSLPRLLKLDPSGPSELCARRQARAGNCPKATRIGTATGRTPLLNQPMEGFLYVVQPQGDGSPDLLAQLSGQGLEVNLRGRTAVEEGRTETRFAGIPDFPLTALRLQLGGGENGLLRLGGSPCGGLVAPTEITGQNAARRALRAPVEVRSGCGGDG